MSKLLGQNPGPINMVFTMNAGAIPANSWVHDLAVGGGRIIGEACHFIDLAAFLSKSKVVAVMANALGPNVAETTDNAIITLRMENGSQAVINYVSNGNKAYSKERAEVYSQGRTLILDNFRRLDGYGFKGFERMKATMDKGHKQQFEQLFARLRSGGEPLIAFDSLVNTTKASFAAIESIKEGKWIVIV
jgi:predicted dehydrogenase